MYAIKNCSIEKERNIGSPKVMTRKRGKYMRPKSGEKKKGKYKRSKNGKKEDREIYSIKEW